MLVVGAREADEAGEWRSATASTATRGRCPWPLRWTNSRPNPGENGAEGRKAGAGGMKVQGQRFKVKGSNCPTGTLDLKFWTLNLEPWTLNLPFLLQLDIFSQLRNTVVGFGFCF